MKKNQNEILTPSDVKSKECNGRKRMRMHAYMSGGVLGLPQRGGFDP